MKFSAQAGEWNPRTSAPSIPWSSCWRMSVGSIRKYVGPAIDVCEKCAIIDCGRSSRRNRGTSAS